MKTVKIRLTDEELGQINGGVTVEKIIPFNVFPKKSPSSCEV